MIVIVSMYHCIDHSVLVFAQLGHLGYRASTGSVIEKLSRLEHGEASIGSIIELLIVNELGHIGASAGSMTVSELGYRASTGSVIEFLIVT
jgi:hypothetical protein